MKFWVIKWITKYSQVLDEILQRKSVEVKIVPYLLNCTRIFFCQNGFWKFHCLHRLCCLVYKSTQNVRWRYKAFPSNMKDKAFNILEKWLQLRLDQRFIAYIFKCYEKLYLTSFTSYFISFSFSFSQWHTTCSMEMQQIKKMKL